MRCWTGCRPGLADPSADPRARIPAPQWAALKRADTSAGDGGGMAAVPGHRRVRERPCRRPEVPALLAALPEATAIPLTWRLFRQCGAWQDRDMPVTETFTRAAPRCCTGRGGRVVQDAVSDDGTYGKLGVHRPRTPTRAACGAALVRRLRPALHSSVSQQRASFPTVARPLCAGAVEPLPAWGDGRVSGQGRPGPRRPRGRSTCDEECWGYDRLSRPRRQLLCAEVLCAAHRPETSR